MTFVKRYHGYSERVYMKLDSEVVEYLHILSSESGVAMCDIVNTILAAAKEEGWKIQPPSQPHASILK